MSIFTTTDDLSLRTMTRASSSAQDSDVLPTPQDDIISLNMPHDKQRVESTAYSEPPHIDDIFIRDAPYASPRQGLAPPRFARPRHEWRSLSSGDAATTHARSARDLISLYEQNRSPQDVGTTRMNPYALEDRRNDPVPTMPLSTYPKHRLPIRESFRNLLSAFGMKKERKDDIGAGPYIPIPRRNDEPEQHRDQQCLELPADVAVHSRGMHSSETVETFSIAREGPLLHLERDDIPPRWHPCEATLHASHLNLRWTEPDGRLNSRDMVLSLCTNVKSVPANAIDPAMSPILGRDESAHVFVMEFENGEERFATLSVTDRVSWVNAVWDGLLRCRDMSTASIEQQDTGNSAAAAEDVGPLRVVNSPSPKSSISEEPPRPSRIMRSLTPTSPSFDRLDSQTLVKQRLAQFEQRFGSMTPATNSTWRSSQSNAAVPRTRPSAQTKQNEMLAESDEQFKTMHSVLDAAFWGGNGVQHRKAASELPANTSTMRRLDELGGIRPSVKRHSTGDPSAPPPIEKDRVPVAITTLCNVGGTTNSPRRTSQDPGLARANSSASSLLDLQPIYDLLNQYSTRQVQTTEHVTSQLNHLRTELSNVVKEVQAASSSASSGPVWERVEGHLSAVINSLSTLNLQPLHAKLDKLANTHVEQLQDVPRRDRPLPPILDFGPVLSSLDDLKRKTRPQPPVDHAPVLEKLQIFEGLHHADHTALVEKLDELRAAMVAREDLSFVLAKLNDLAAPKDPQSPMGVPPWHSADVSATLSQILDRLDAINPAALSEAGAHAVSLLAVPSDADSASTPLPSTPTSPRPTVAHTNDSADAPEVASLSDQQIDEASTVVGSKDNHAVVMEELRRLSAFAKASRDNSEKLGSQHSDSVRYLNDLNTWLSAFVANTTANVDQMSMQIARLHEELGIPPTRTPAPATAAATMPDAPGIGAEPAPETLADVSSSAPDDAPSSGGLLQDMRQFLAENKRRPPLDQDAVQSAMRSLMAGVAQDLDRNAQERQKLATDSVVGFMEHQRQANEALLRSIAADLSNDIRGERLRFVEAMKEATTVNIQFHVEAFKKELTKEVLNMTLEVERLQRERQMLQMQISELFAFFSKQKPVVAQQGNRGADARPLPDATPAPAQTMANLPPQRRRA